MKHKKAERFSFVDSIDLVFFILLNLNQSKYKLFEIFSNL